jgi:hypothetical protein
MLRLHGEVSIRLAAGAVDASMHTQNHFHGLRYYPVSRREARQREAE